ncbi:hypothetical protein Goshw_007846 [Gossypium schwendimanii]|uniref:Uncharacterized protein n=1 Tax=Gossypium schwendimanii TaxID=34291 RepID=A0A7J9L235_GOSSC|nr:hypothetical protein [Gossypium schwendimanii]
MSVETLSTYLSINNEGDKYHTGSYDTSLSRPNDYVGNDMDIHEPQASTVPLVDTQSSDAPRSSYEAYPALPTSPSPRTICLLKVINGPSLQVNASVNALTAHFDDRYNQLDKRINELASWFPPPSTIRTSFLG